MIKFLNTGKGSGSAIGETKLNVFCQTNEPSIKDGIWLKDITNYNKLMTADTISADLIYNDVLSSLPNSTSYRSIASVGTNIYIFGGNGDAYYYKAYKYDTITNIYTSITDIPYPLKGAHCAVAVGTDIYLIGTSANYTVYSKKAFKYDTITNTYTQIADFPTYCYNHTMVSIGNKVYIVGGSSTTTAIYEYDIYANTYKQVGTMPAIVTYGCAVVVDKYIYIISSTNHYRFDTVNNTIVTLSKVPYAHDYGNAIYYQGDIYLFCSKTVYKYNIATDTYTQLESTDINGNQNGEALVGNSMYIIINKTLQKIDIPTVEVLENNSVVLLNGNKYKTNLLTPPDNVVGNIGTSFADVFLTDDNSNLIEDINIYYGTDSKWIQLKGEFSYKELEYIESTGREYINTKVCVNNYLEFEIKFNMVAVNGTYEVIIGGRTTADTNMYGYWHQRGGSLYDRSFRVPSGTYVLTSATTYRNVDTTVSLVKNTDNASAILTVTDGINTDTLSISDITSVTEYPVYLFGMNSAGNLSDSSIIRLYHCKLWDNGVLVRDFVPVIRSDNTVGLLDKVTNTFYGNAGTGEFIAGPEVS